jgi:hypothetical protein
VGCLDSARWERKEGERVKAGDWSLRTALGLSALFVFPVATARAGYITNDDIYPLDGNYTGSGNGTLDFILLTESAGGSGNFDNASGFDADDSNTNMPSGVTGGTATESFITSMGELRDFYTLNFPTDPVTGIGIFVDLNQITGGLDLILNTLTVTIDYDPNFLDARDYPAANDLESVLQNSTSAGFTGGVVEAALDGIKILPLVEQGAGWADYLLVTDINPFDSAYTDTTRVLFHWDSLGHDDGGETIFLSGTYSPGDIPEPASVLVLALGALAVTRRRR